MDKSQKLGIKRRKRKEKVARKNLAYERERLFWKKSPAERAKILYERRHAKDDAKKKKEAIRKELGFKQ